ncbi:PAS domain S-box protein [Desulfobacula sp.]|jgi:PAS domain S-box-containing protein|uniref:hybrid sensor histidine kinase/response regulator n=3 Tax=Desulfobacula sp. TaxID=2593537 RepID=UPI001DAEB374|nr:PAS domain S-box protein [Desulfobacula sp.]
MIEKPSYEELEKRIQELERVESNFNRSKGKLIHSYDLMDYIISHARSAIAVFDRDFKYIYVSKRYLTDYKVKEQHVIGKHHYEVFPDIPQKWKDVHQRSLAGEVLRAEEDLYYREDGSIDWTRWECRPWYEYDGSIGGIVIYNEVINERKKIEETLRKSEQLLSTHLLNTPIGAISWDLNFKTVEWNPAAETIFGYTKDEALSKHAAELILPEDMKELVDVIFQDLISEKGGTRSTNENITKGGRRIICDWYNTALKDADGKVIGIASFVSDITERVQANEGLRKSEEKFRTLFHTSPNAITLTSAENGVYIDVNDGFTKMLGYSKEDVIGKTSAELNIWNDFKDRELLASGLKKYGLVDDLEADFKGKNGQIKSGIMSAHLLNIENKNIIFAITRNVTEQRKLESQLQQSQRMESIGTLAGGIAHDFNNILSPIVGYTEMVLLDTPEDSPVRDSLNQVYTSALRAKDLVNQILTFSRQDSSELMLMKMQPIVKEALKLIRSTISTTIEIIQDINPDCGVVKADPTQIHQIVMNLATNAYHAMEETGGELKVSLKEVELGEYDIITPDMTPGVYACLIVADTGVGMDKILTNKIFDPFFTTKEVGKGTGMGLSVVHGIVISMGGTIHVYSEPGKGTQFHVYLPVIKSAAEKPKIQTQVPIQGGTEQILLVDDEEAILSMEKRMLERLGYQVTSRTSSLEALEAFRSNPDKFDMIITDMAMPNMPGDKLSVELIKIRPDIPVLLCTGFSEAMSVEKAASLGIKGFLLKPIIMKDLAQKIREVLDACKI